jgi:rod shape-determining protein MreC
MEAQQTSFFVRGPSPLARLTFFATISLVLMAVDARLHYLAEVRQGFATLLHPLELLAAAPLRAYYSVEEYFADLDAVTREARTLREQNMRQAVDLQRLATLQAENDHLRQLLGARQALPQPTRLAEIMHASRDPFVQRIIVNSGSQQGVAAGQAVVDGLGVIGQVTRAYPFSSEVTLITDRELAVPVQVERNGLRAIAFGHGRDNTLDLPYLPVNVDIREGDRLVTSGIDGTYPHGLAVATVKRIERNVDSPFAHIVCVPVAGTDKHGQVLILASAVTMPELPPEESHAARKKETRHHALHPR